MRTDLYDEHAPRKPTNLTVNSDLLQQAKELGINLSRTFEESLAQAVRTKRREQWLKENQEALDAYNEHTERDGTFSDGLRNF